MLSPYEQVKTELKERPRTWLITGVAGFIGSNLLETLLQLDQSIIGLDNFSTGHKKNLEDVLSEFTAKQQKKFHFIEGDIRSFADCEQALEKVDYVLHQAALGSVPRSIKTPIVTHDTNVTGFLNILIAAKNANVKRFVYASSSSVYGDSPHLPKQEENIGNPLSPYAVSKHSNELNAKAFSTCYGIETIGLRYFNVFGQRQDPNGPYAAVIPRWIAALSQHNPVEIYGDGETSRDFCPVENIVQANLLAAVVKNKDAINTVYNIAVGEQHTLNQLHALIIKNLQAAEALKPIYREFRTGDIRHSLANTEKAKKLLGYQAICTLQDGIKKLLWR